MIRLKKRMCTYEFGSFRLILQPHNNLFPARVLRNEAEIPDFTKSGLACRLLVHLVRNRANQINTWDLTHTLWSGKEADELQDAKRSLTAVIQKVRILLDESDQRRYIERFKSQVQFVYRPVIVHYIKRNPQIHGDSDSAQSAPRQTRYDSSVDSCILARGGRTLKGPGCEDAVGTCARRNRR